MSAYEMRMAIEAAGEGRGWWPRAPEPQGCLLGMMLWLLNWLLHLSLPFLSLPRTRGFLLIVPVHLFVVCIVYLCSRVCVHTWKPEVDLISLPPLLLLIQGLSLNLGLAD